ncbi:MAG: OB-fold nucleic acid binding domain-containing protein, partial [Actinomycetota bacterium]|nr:OB-fold nucleic acid binding domain-containing protein [Actinomycetota bacterium]
MGDDEGRPTRLAQLVAERRAKLAALRGRGVEPYPVDAGVTDALADVAAAFAKRLAPGEGSGESVAVGGRLVARRGHGRLVFLVLEEADARLQAMARLNRLGPAGMQLAGELDVGDWVAARGEAVRSRRGELSVDASELRLIGKALRPLPDKWHGLRDVETRFRQREVDL